MTAVVGSKIQSRGDGHALLLQQALGQIGGIARECAGIGPQVKRALAAGGQDKA
ncbi:hypothetical protein D3C72_2589600 [compost metagenome]